MENNENGIQNESGAGADNGYTQPNDPFASVENGGFTQGGAANNNGWTQASGGYSMNGQPVNNAYNQPQQQGSQGMAIAGMVLGIISLVCCCLGWIAAVLAVVSLVLSIISLVQHKPGKGMAICGIVCAAISLVLVIILYVLAGSVSPSDLQELQRTLEELESMQ